MKKKGGDQFKPNKNKKRNFFSPTNGPPKEIIKSLVYFAITFIIGYLVWLKFKGITLAYTGIFEPQIYIPTLIGLIFFPLALSYIVHRPHKKGIVMAGLIFILLFIYQLVVSSSEDRGLLVVFVLPAMAGGFLLFILLPFLFRAYYRIGSKTKKFLILISPYILFLVFLLFIFFSTNTLEDCQKLHESKKPQCYNVLAAREKNLSICYSGVYSG